jgi:hypothetical protein
MIQMYVKMNPIINVSNYNLTIINLINTFTFFCQEDAKVPGTMLNIYLIAVPDEKQRHRCGLTLCL